MTTTHTYYPSGVCAKQIDVSLTDGKIDHIVITGGCDGYSHAVERLLPGMDARDAIQRMKGVECGDRPTSCCDQITRALEELLDSLEASPQ